MTDRTTNIFVIICAACSVLVILGAYHNSIHAMRRSMETQERLRTTVEKVIGDIRLDDVLQEVRELRRVIENEN